jgi:hypothetical protein
MRKPKGFEALEAIEESVYELYHAKKYENMAKVTRKEYPKVIVDEVVARAFQRAANLYPSK